MNTKIDEYVIKTIVDTAIFFEFSEDNIINTDVSIQMLEQMAATLQSSMQNTREFLCKEFKRLSINYSGEQCEFVGRLGDIFGLEANHNE
jgi:hypothetical protein